MTTNNKIKLKYIPMYIMPRTKNSWLVCYYAYQILNQPLLAKACAICNL